MRISYAIRVGLADTVRRTVLLLVVGVVVGGLVIGYGQMRSHGFRVMRVQSNSMYPVFRKGDAVVIRRTEPRRLVAGDIVSYRLPEQPAVTVSHRVVSVNQAQGQIYTRGDANWAPDRPVSFFAVQGTVHHVVPKAGYALAALQSWWGVALLVYLPAFVVVWAEVSRLAGLLLRPTYQLPGFRQG